MTSSLINYKRNDIGLFDDFQKNIVEESSELTSEIQRGAGLQGDTLTITFSENSFEENQHELLWQDSRDNCMCGVNIIQKI